MKKILIFLACFALLNQSYAKSVKDSSRFSIVRKFFLEDDISGSVMKYFSVSIPKIMNVPLYENSIGDVTVGENTGFGLSAGYSIYANWFTLGTRLDYAYVKISGFPSHSNYFSSANNSTRSLHYFMFDILNIGVVPITRKIPVSLHAHLGIGFVTQSNYVELMENAIGETEYPAHFCLELRVNLIKNIIFKTEISQYTVFTETPDGSLYRHNTTNSQDVGNVFSIGLIFYKLKY
jgi:hypothetical protein